MAERMETVIDRKNTEEAAEILCFVQGLEEENQNDFFSIFAGREIRAEPCKRKRVRRRNLRSKHPPRAGASF